MRGVHLSLYYIRRRLVKGSGGLLLYGGGLDRLDSEEVGDSPS